MLRWTGRSKLTYLANILIGYAAAILNVVFLAPMEKIATRVLVDDHSQGLVAVARDIHREEGVKGFYVGWTSTFYVAWNPAIQNAVFDQMRLSLLRDRAKLDLLESFALGAFSKAVATCLTYPAVRVKTLLQSASDGGDGRSMLASISDIFAEDGVVGIFRGINPTLQKGVIQSAFMLMVRERVDFVVRALLGMARR